MQKRVFIIHGWTGKPNQHWLPWLANELEQVGYKVYQPEMPDTDNPNMDAWVSFLKEQVGAANRDTYFVGHSIGCLAVLRYLEKYNEKIGGAVLVAPWVEKLNPESYEDPEDKKVIEEWTSLPVDWGKLKELCPFFTAIFSEDDPDVPLQDNEPTFRKKLGAKTVIEKNMGHFTTDDGVTALPSALAAILEMARVG